MTKVGIVRRHEDGKAGAIFKTVRLAAVKAALYVFHLGAKTFHHAKDATNHTYNNLKNWA